MSKVTSKQTNSILNKWRKQGSFIRFLDSNKLNCAVSNLAYVSLKEAMDNIHEWVVDWDMDLTQNERNIVLTPEFRAGLSFGNK
jgi:hypothetical protein